MSQLLQRIKERLNTDLKINLFLFQSPIHIPARVILESEFALEDVKDLKSDVLRWMICAEVSCDMTGFLSCECNADAFCLAMFKYTTGLTAQTIQTDNQRDNLINLMLERFRVISESEFDSIITTHPLTPLRL